MHLIVGSKRIDTQNIHRIAGGVEATLRGEALLSVLDATFHGVGTIEVAGGDREIDRRPLDVTSIKMKGYDTCVTLICTGPPASLM